MTARRAARERPSAPASRSYTAILPARHPAPHLLSALDGLRSRECLRAPRDRGRHDGGDALG